MKFTSSELADAPNLDVEIPSYNGSHPISCGKSVEKFRAGDLRKVAGQKSERMDFFEKMLLALWIENGKEPVPFVFCTIDGAIRSLDAGCLGHLHNKSPPEVQFVQDELGYISSVSPASILIDRYAVMGEAAILKAMLGEAPVHGERQVDTSQPLEEPLGFDPDAPIDEKTKRYSLQARREGAREFRRNILRHWGKKCPLTGRRMTAALDAAHIFRYGGRKTNDIRNGIALRADLHRLFDRHLLSFFYDDGDLVFTMHAKVARYKDYAHFDGFKISAADLPRPRPHPSVVARHYKTHSEA